MRLCFFRLLMLALVLAPSVAFGQLEVGGGYTHMSGDSGLDGFNASVGWQFSRRVELIGDGDFIFDNSRVGVFDLSSSTGTVRVKSNLQNYLVGARVRVIGWKPLKSIEKRKLLPFGEILIGASRLSQTVTDTAGTVSLNASDKAFTWALGGGAEYTLSNRWLARTRLDLVRTHFVDAGQSRFRFSLGVAYAF